LHVVKYSVLEIPRTVLIAVKVVPPFAWCLLPERERGRERESEREKEIERSCGAGALTVHFRMCAAFKYGTLHRNNGKRSNDEIIWNNTTIMSRQSKTGDEMDYL
jgi:hypothetical protein